MDMINIPDYDVRSLFSSDGNSAPPRSPHERAKRKADRAEMETFYLKVEKRIFSFHFSLQLLFTLRIHFGLPFEQKFGDQVLINNLYVRVQAKLTSIQKALGEGNYADQGSRFVTVIIHIINNIVLAFSYQILSRLPSYHLLVLPSLPPSLPPKPALKRRIGKAPKLGEAKLFGGTIQEYVDATGEKIPMVIRSTIQVALNLTNILNYFGQILSALG